MLFNSISHNFINLGACRDLLDASFEKRYFSDDYIFFDGMLHLEA